MAENIRIMSLNCRGLGNTQKRKDVLNYLRQKKFSIYCLQDTHFTKDIENRIRSEWGYKTYFSHGKSDARGVCILMNNNFEHRVLDEKADEDGNFLVLKLELEKKITMSLVTIYGPNRDNPSFFDNIASILAEFDSEFITMCGDMNMVQDYDLDCLNYVTRNNPKNREALLGIQDGFRLVDPWRIHNENLRRYTWFRKNPTKSARLDYFLTSEELMSMVEKPRILPGYRTDHSIITIELRLSSFKKGKGFWKFNNSLLREKAYIDKVNTEISETIKQYISPIHKDEDLKSIHPEDMQFTISEMILLNIRSLTIKYSAERKRQRNDRKLILEKQIQTLRNILNYSQSSFLENFLQDLENELQQIRNDYMKGLAIRSRANWIENGEKPTKYFCNLEKRNYINKNITKIIRNDGIEIIDQKEILHEIQYFYKDLYSNKDIFYEEKDLDEMLSKVDISKIDESTKCKLELPLDIYELTNSLKNMKNDKSPGPDGFTSEFFKIFWKDLKYFLLRSINEGIEKGELSITQKQGIISIIPKGDKVRELLKNWRPISLLNITYKIFSGCMAARLKTVLIDIIHENQKGFLKNRFIGENIRQLYDIMFIAEEENIPGLLVMIDFEKAFDSISWKYMDKILKFFNFGPFFIHMLKTLYHNASLCVIQHGFFSEFFKIERGCRQGDPVSPYLFILCVEILGALIRAEKDIKGINIGQNNYKILQYADDTALTLDGSEKSLRITLNLLDQFAKFSGLKPNINKTKSVWIGSKINSIDILCSDRDLKWTNEPFTFLGVTFSTDLMSIPELNYTNKFEEIKNTIRSWSKRLISPLGKITIVKSLLLSKLTHLFISLPKPGENEIKELEKMFYKFIWNNKNDRVARKQIIQSYKNGGLKMIHTMSFIKTMKLSWIKRILTSENSWMKIFNCIINEDYKHIFMFGDKYLQKLIHRTHNPFWKEVLKNLFEFRSKLQINDKDLIYQPLWYNSNIRIGNESIFYKSWFNKGICNVHHLFTKEGSFMSYQQFTDTYQFYPPYTLFLGLKHTILTKWPYLKNIVLYHLPNFPTYIRLVMTYKSKSASVYNVFIDKIDIHNYIIR